MDCTVDDEHCHINPSRDYDKLGSSVSSRDCRAALARIRAASFKVKMQGPIRLLLVGSFVLVQSVKSVVCVDKFEKKLKGSKTNFEFKIECIT